MGALLGNVFSEDDKVSLFKDMVYTIKDIEY